MRRTSILAALAAVSTFAAASAAHAALITFSGIEPAAGRTLADNWWGNPSADYQPLLQTYAGLSGTNSATSNTYNTVADGADLGVTVNFQAMITDQSGGGHTGDTPDYYIKGWGTANPWLITTFSTPVSVDSFYYKGDYNAQANGAVFEAFTNASDTTPVATIAVGNTGSSWGQMTSFAGMPIEKLVLSLPNTGNVLIDDMTVNAVPEPASLGLLGLGALLLPRSRRRRR